MARQCIKIFNQFVFFIEEDIKENIAEPIAQAGMFLHLINDRPAFVPALKSQRVAVLQN